MTDQERDQAITNILNRLMEIERRLLAVEQKAAQPQNKVDGGSFWPEDQGQKK